MADMLPIFRPEGDKIPDLLDSLLTVKVVEDAAAEAKRELRANLQKSILDFEEQTGSAFTARGESGSATITAPEPKMHVTDPAAFADEILTYCPNDPILDIIETVKVADRKKAIALVQQAEGIFNGSDEDHRTSRVKVQREMEQMAASIIEALDVQQTVVPKPEAAELLIGSGKIALTPNGAYWSASGEMVAGVEVRIANRTLQVRHPKEAKQRRLNDMLAPTEELTA